MDIAVVGSGISGLSAAWLLSQRHRVHLFESAPRLGGHTNTISLPPRDGAPQPAIDTGFIVYNEATYPNLVALFEHLGVATQASDMSFAVSLDDGRLEYGGNDFGSLFAQKRNLVSPRFLAMLWNLMRFYREAPRRAAALEGLSLGDLLDQGKFGRAFRDDHLLPMAAAIWSAPCSTLLDFPALAFVRFCENHGLLRVTNRPIWRAVTGGSQSYLAPLTAPFAERIHLGCGIESIRRTEAGVTLRESSGKLSHFDHVVVATHADQALAMIEAPSEAERVTLGAFRYSENRAILHCDARLMPRRRAVWSAWNYLGRSGGESGLSVTYWMNKLQSLPGVTDYFVTLNPATTPRDILHEETYHHPVFDLKALAAQKALWRLQGRGNLWFCGAHFGSGFHEDGLQSGLAVAEALGGVRRPWSLAPDWSTAAESARIYLSPCAAPALSDVPA